MQSMGRKNKPQGKEQRTLKEPNVRRCFNCNEEGHLIADCPKPKRERGSCFKCGKLGHQAAQCKSSADVNYIEQGTREDNDFRRIVVELQISNGHDKFAINILALIDSGSPICFVKECYIPRKCLIVEAERERFCGLNDSGLKSVV